MSALPIPYPAVAAHGVVGDRRSAALIAADGTLDWLCLPHYSGGVAFGALLDCDKGGHFRLGPSANILGVQHYRDDTATLVTSWQVDNSILELSDVMVWPQDEKPHEREDQRILIRRLRCTRGLVRCSLDVSPRWNFSACAPADMTGASASMKVGPHLLSLWTTRPVHPEGQALRAVFDLGEGDEFWAVLQCGGTSSDWSIARAKEVCHETDLYWRRWTQGLPDTGPRHARLRRSGLLIHLLSYAPTGATVAAPTTSVPERLGAGWNADYRFSWVRDTSLSLSGLAWLGKPEDCARYLDWLCGLGSSVRTPLQVLYGVQGEMELPQREREDIYGYRGSRPVRFGNHACKQLQHDVLGYLLDCVLIHLNHGGSWRPEFWELVRRAAEYVARHWQETGNSIWELSVEQQYLSGKIMSWVALDRGLRIAEKVRAGGNLNHWRRAREEIHADVMDRGWSDRLGAFRQRYEGDNLDAAALLIPLMGFLPADHPRVTATIKRIVESLCIDGFVYRFIPSETPGTDKLPLGEYEAAFLPCTFWLVTALAKIGAVRGAEALLRRAEVMTGPLGLFSEGADPRTGTFMGNFPLLFSQAEYVRAALEIARMKGRLFPEEVTHERELGIV